MSKNHPEGLAHAKKLIERNLELKTRYLNLSNCGITDLRDLPDLLNLKHLEILNFGNSNEICIFGKNYINDKDMETITYNLNSLIKLDISGNNISNRSIELISRNLSNLKSLNVSDINLDLTMVKLICEKLNNLESLYLNSCSLSHDHIICVSKNLDKLKRLELNSNNLQDNDLYSISFANFELIHFSLESNDISDKGIKYIIKVFKNLQNLNISQNKISDQGLSYICRNFLNLEYLSVNETLITHAGVKTISDALMKLKSLNISNNNIGDKGLRNINNKVLKLESLNISNNNISDEGISALVRNVKINSKLLLRSNGISDSGVHLIAEKYPYLKVLDISDNNISDFGAEIIAAKIKKLEILNIGNNNITSKGAKLISESLNKIKYLNIEKNNITDISCVLKNIKNHSIDESYIRNPIITPPNNIVRQGIVAVQEYFHQKERSGSKLLFEAKMILMGDGRAGKTSLACRLLEKELPTESDRTLGVDIIIGNYTFRTDGGEFKLHIWDFAGQDKYKPLHQFFYSESSVYVLVADSGNALTNFADWFETAELYGEGSPLIVVMNEFSDGIGMGTFDEISWRRQFPTLIQKVHLVNLLNQNGFRNLEKDIRHLAYQLPHTKFEFPQNWANIRTELEKRRDENFISIQEYLRICKNNDLPERESALILSSVLHKIGVCLHYQKSELLSQIVILKNEWATTAVYKILEDPFISNDKKGFFNIHDLKRIWSEDGYQDMIPQLLHLMCEFKLAYPLPNNREFITPPLLPRVPPNDWKAIDGQSVLVLVEYVFLPKALLTQFITSRHLDIDNGRTLVWRDGVVLRWPSDTIAEIRKIKSQGRDAFQIIVKGIEQKGLLTSILKSLRDLHQEYKGIQVFEYVPCTCEGCTSKKNKQQYFEFSKLTHRIENNRRKVECDESLFDVDILGLLGNLVFFEESAKSGRLELKREKTEVTNAKEIKIFLASSSELAEDRDDFELYFRQQNDILPDEMAIYLKIVRWEYFLDAMSETRLQDEYNKEVKDCDIFVSLFFTKTGKYTEEEFDVAHNEFQASGGVKPQIFTFFKNAEIKTGSITNEIKTLLTFQEKLKSLGHYHTQYDNIDQLNLKFSNQLDWLVREGKI